MNLEILPLAITMMAGPAIMAAIIFVTHPQAVRVSLAYLVGVAIGTTVGVAIFAGLASLLGDNVSLGDSSDTGSAGTIIQIALVALLIAAAIKNYVRRETVEPPKWLGKLMAADARKALVAGLLVILLGPSDIVVMLTVGTNLEHSGASLVDAVPFIVATVLIAALPLLGFVLFQRRARTAMPKVRDWVNTHAWLVNIAVCCIFIALIL
jgi:Sap-like sulfolipid-1-addressing protein